MGERVGLHITPLQAEEHAMEAKSHRIFISHASEDNDFVIKLAEDLRHVLRDEQAVWFDADLKGGQSWWRLIMNQIENRSIFLLIVSPSAMRSEWVHQEIDIAIKERNNRLSRRRAIAAKQILQIYYRQCPPTGRAQWRSDLQTFQCISLLPPEVYGSAFIRKLLQSFDPPITMSQGQIERRLRETDLSYTNEMVPEVQAAVESGDSVAALKLLRQYTDSHYKQERWDDALRHIEDALQIAPNDTLWLNYKRAVEMRAQSQHEHISKSYKPRQERQPYTYSQVAQAANTNKKATNRRKTVKEASATLQNQGMIQPVARSKKLPTMRYKISPRPTIGETLQLYATFIRKGFSLRQIGKKCRGRFYSFLSFLFFVVDAIVSPIGMYSWTRSWIVAIGPPLLFLLGLLSKQDWIATLLTVVLGVLIILAGSYYLPSAIFSLCIISLVLSIFRLSLFLKRR